MLGVLLEFRVPFDRTVAKTLAASLFAKSKVVSAKKTMYIWIWFFERLDICSFEANRWVNYVRLSSLGIFSCIVLIRLRLSDNINLEAGSQKAQANVEESETPHCDSCRVKS